MPFLQHAGRAFDPRIEKKGSLEINTFRLSLVGATVMSRETRNLRIFDYLHVCFGW
jgi:hypothetical protein